MTPSSTASSLATRSCLFLSLLLCRSTLSLFPHPFLFPSLSYSVIRSPPLALASLCSVPIHPSPFLLFSFLPFSPHFPSALLSPHIFLLSFAESALRRSARFCTAAVVSYFFSLLPPDDVILSKFIPYSLPSCACAGRRSLPFFSVLQPQLLFSSMSPPPPPLSFPCPPPPPPPLPMAIVLYSCRSLLFYQKFSRRCYSIQLSVRSIFYFIFYSFLFCFIFGVCVCCVWMNHHVLACSLAILMALEAIRVGVVRWSHGLHPLSLHIPHHTPHSIRLFTLTMILYKRDSLTEIHRD